MSVELEPAELGFRRPFTNEVSQILRLHNSNSQPVLFKVKTTAPKQYCVRPNSGRIDPGAQVEVQVLLQAMKEDPAPDAKCRDKFLVQSFALDAEKEHGNVAQVWQGIEQTAKSSIHEKKIRVVFLPADGSAAVNGYSHVEESSFRESPTPAPRTPMRGNETSASGPAVAIEDRPAGSKDLGTIASEASNPASESTASAAYHSVASSLPTSDDLQAQLAEAKATITRLQAQAQEAVLRQRKAASDSKATNEKSGSGLAVQHAPAGGVPVQLTAGLCLLCFLIAYFFF